MRGDGEGEPHVHPAGVALDRRVEEPLDLGEGDDLVELAADLAPAHAEDGAVEEDVLPAGELRVEAGADLEQRCRPGPSISARPAVGSVIRGQDLEQGALAGAVAADDARPPRPGRSRSDRSRDGLEQARGGLRRPSARDRPQRRRGQLRTGAPAACPGRSPGHRRAGSASSVARSGSRRRSSAPPRRHAGRLEHIGERALQPPEVEEPADSRTRWPTATEAISGRRRRRRCRAGPSGSPRPPRPSG